MSFKTIDRIFALTFAILIGALIGLFILLIYSEKNFTEYFKEDKLVCISHKATGWNFTSKTTCYNLTPIKK